MVFHWSYSKFPQVSMILLNILADLSTAIVWMVSARPPISNASSLFNKPLGIVPSAQITIGITVIFHNIFSSQASSKYFSLFSLSLIFTLKI